MSALVSLPPHFAETRESLRALACYVLSPARKARTGLIGLRAFDGGIATPPFDDGTRIAVRGDELRIGPHAPHRISTLRDAAGQLGIALVADPGVGHDLPPFAPDAVLALDAAASLAIGDWYAYGQSVLDTLTLPVVATETEAQIWPEHFDLATEVVLVNGRRVNIGFSPGDGYQAKPYVYVGPQDVSGLVGPFWNASFGAVLGHDELLPRADTRGHALRFIAQGLELLT